jgi:hypothetical protein
MSGALLDVLMPLTVEDIVDEAYFSEKLVAEQP